jgi:hypothetical protein
VHHFLEQKIQFNSTSTHSTSMAFTNNTSSWMLLVRPHAAPGSPKLTLALL